jgi:isomerase DpgB
MTASAITGLAGLTVRADEPLGPDLLTRVAAACTAAERTGGPLLLRLGGGTAATWPGPDAGVDTVNRWERAVRRVERLPAPVVALLVGWCTGPATELLLAADHRLALTSVRIGVATVRDNLAWPGMALHRLVAEVGTARARQLALLGVELTATQAVQLGLLDGTSDDLAAAEALAARAVTDLAGTDGTELAVRRRLLHDAAFLSHEDAVGAHLAACDRALRRDQPAATGIVS